MRPAMPRAADAQPRRRSCSRRSWCARRSKQSFVMLRPDIQWANPVMFVVEVGAFLTLLFVIQAAAGHRHEPGADHLLHRAGCLAVPDGAVRQLRHRAGRGARQGAGRVAAAGRGGTRRPIGCAPTAYDRGSLLDRSASRATGSWSKRGQIIPGRRRDHRRHRVGR